MSPERSAAEHTFQLRRRMAARGAWPGAPKCALVPSGHCTSSEPWASADTSRVTTRAAAGARGGSDTGVARVGCERLIGLLRSSRDEDVRRAGFAEERHALEPQQQRLPVD